MSDLDIGRLATRLWWEVVDGDDDTYKEAERPRESFDPRSF